MNNADVLDRALNAVVDRLSSTEKQLSDLVLSLQVPNTTSTPSPASKKLEAAEPVTIPPVTIPAPGTFLEQEQANDLITDPIPRSTDQHNMMKSEIENTQEEEVADEPGAEESPHEDAPLSSQSSQHYPWYEKLNQATDQWLESHDYSSSDQASLKAVGIGTLVGIILLGSYHLLSK